MFRTFCQTQMPASEKQTLARGMYYSLIQDWFLDAGIQDLLSVACIQVPYILSGFIDLNRLLELTVY